MGHPSLRRREIALVAASLAVFSSTTFATFRNWDRDTNAAPSKALPEPWDPSQATPFRLLPEISLLRPPEDSSTYEPQPPFVLQFEALCNGAPCSVHPDYLATLRLSALLNGQPVASEFRYDSRTGQSAYTPNAPLPFGNNPAILGAARAKVMYYAVYRFGPRWTLSPAAVAEGFGMAPAAMSVPTPLPVEPFDAASFEADASLIRTADLDVDAIEALAKARSSASG